jgi:uncharacterized membrane protein YhaH (DUF805 family)
MQLSHYFSFDGRIGRLSYLKRQLAFALLVVPLTLLLVALWLSGASGLALLLTIVIGLAYFIVSVHFSLAQGAKRAHDLGHSGWIQLLALVPVVNFFFALYLYLAPGQEPGNHYGMPMSG